MSYYQKYLKYKNKYLELKNQSGGLNIKRINKEIERLNEDQNLEIEIITNDHIKITKRDLLKTYDIIFPDSYPFKGPIIKINEQQYFIPNEGWSPSMSIKNILENDAILEKYTPSVAPSAVPSVAPSAVPLAVPVPIVPYVRDVDDNQIAYWYLQPIKVQHQQFLDIINRDTYIFKMNKNKSVSTGSENYENRWQKLPENIKKEILTYISQELTKRNGYPMDIKIFVRPSLKKGIENEDTVLFYDENYLKKLAIASERDINDLLNIFKIIQTDPEILDIIAIAFGASGRDYRNFDPKLDLKTPRGRAIYDKYLELLK